MQKYLKNGSAISMTMDGLVLKLASVLPSDITGLEAGVNKPTTVEEWVAMPHPEDIERMKELRDWQEAEDKAASELSFRGADEDVRD